MKLSKYFRKKLLPSGNYVLYNTLLMKPIIVSSEELIQIEEMALGDSTDVDELLHAGVFVLDEEIDNHALNDLQHNVESRFGEINVVYLILTNACNLRCTYCAVKNIADKNSITCTDYLKKSEYDKFISEYISYAKLHCISEPEFIFYGGEPLLNWDALVDIVETFEKLNDGVLNPKFTIVTNGTLLTEDKVVFCKEHQVNIGLSVDGPLDITNKARKTSKGEGAYSLILQALELLKKHDNVPSLSITISEEVLQNKSEVLNWLETMSIDYHIRDISYNLLHFQGLNFDKEKYNREASDFIIKSYQKLGDIISDSRINRKIRALTSSTFFYGDCAAITGNQIVLKANGEIGLCQAFCQSDETTVGNIKNDDLGEIIEMAIVPALQEYKQFMPIFRSSCQDCEAIFACGGGCYWEVDDHSMHCDTGFCQYSKIIHDWMLNCIDN